MTSTHSVFQGRITKRYSTEVCWDDVLFHLCSIVLVPKLQGKVSHLIEGELHSGQPMRTGGVPSPFQLDTSYVM